MSHVLISRSPDLKRLRDEGYDIAVRAAHLLVRDVPYVDSQRRVRRGTLVTTLNLANDVTTVPDTHVMLFSGEPPCHRDGSEIVQIQNSSHPGKVLADGLTVDRRFSAKPEGGRYRDYHEKVVTYVRILSGPAEALEPGVSAQTYPLIEADDEDSVFRYVDTASSRAGLTRASEKLALSKVGIVGLGGTGSYILDFIAKTPAKEISLIDGDTFRQHNAFRAPGAASGDQLEDRPRKVDYFKEVYGRMHRGITPHPEYLGLENLNLLEGMDFVFLCFDGGDVKRAAVEALVSEGTPFIDVGMGLEVVDGAVTGLVRVTTGTPEGSQHVLSGGRISFARPDDDALYSTNIQVADLNALNAALAVVKFKKLFGFYLDLEREQGTNYIVNANEFANELGP